MFWNRKTPPAWFLNQLQQANKNQAATSSPASAYSRPQSVHIDDYHQLSKTVAQHEAENARLTETVKHQQGTIAHHEEEIGRLNTIIHGRAELAQLMIAAIRLVQHPHIAPVAPAGTAQPPESVAKQPS